MFVETVTSPEQEWRRWSEKLQLHKDRPATRVASVAWRSDDGTVVQLDVWDTPGAVADNFIERVRPSSRRRENQSTSRTATASRWWPACDADESHAPPERTRWPRMELTSPNGSRTLPDPSSLWVIRRSLNSLRRKGGGLRMIGRLHASTRIFTSMGQTRTSAYEACLRDTTHLH